MPGHARLSPEDLRADAGGLEAAKSFSWRIKRYQSIQEAQARGVRERFLISDFTQGAIGGADIGVGALAPRERIDAIVEATSLRRLAPT